MSDLTRNLCLHQKHDNSSGFLHVAEMKRSHFTVFNWRQFAVRERRTEQFVQKSGHLRAHYVLLSWLTLKRAIWPLAILLWFCSIYSRSCSHQDQPISPEHASFAVQNDHIYSTYRHFTFICSVFTGSDFHYCLTSDLGSWGWSQKSCFDCGLYLYFLFIFLTTHKKNEELQRFNQS